MTEWDIHLIGIICGVIPGYRTLAKKPCEWWDFALIGVGLALLYVKV